jgi:DNA-binding transcriptional LysR family regulator
MAALLFAGLSSDFACQVERGELDAAFVTQPPRALPSGLLWTRLYDEPMVMIAPRRPHFEMPAHALDAISFSCPAAHARSERTSLSRRPA